MTHRGTSALLLAGGRQTGTDGGSIASLMKIESQSRQVQEGQLARQWHCSTPESVSGGAEDMFQVFDKVVQV